MALSPYEKHRRYITKKRAESPLKPCECGCGTLIPSINSMGKPARFVQGHNSPGETTRYKKGRQIPAAERAKLFPRSAEHSAKLSEATKGRTLSPETRARISAGLLKPDAGRNALHAWVRRHHPKTGTCEDCGKRGRTEYASTNGHRYTRNRADYVEVCRSCHLRRDHAEGRRLSQRSIHRCLDCGSVNVEVVHG